LAEFPGKSSFAKSAKQVSRRWQVGQRLVKEIQAAVEKEQLTPLDGASDFVGRSDFVRLRRVHPSRDLAGDAASDSAKQQALAAHDTKQGEGRMPFLPA
jgi:hypothetical protein